MGNGKYELVLSDDIDSLVATCVVQSVKKHWTTEYFYDFKNIYCTNDVRFIENKAPTRVWVDVAIVRDEKAFDVNAP